MRLSPRQYELLVEYMEKHGDISKLSNGTVIGGSYMHHWAKLTNILNSDSEPPRTTEIWKRVWSDVKANIKKKVARISKNGKSTRSVLSELEERVINVQNQTVNITAEIIEYPEFSLKQDKSQKKSQNDQLHEKFSEFHVIHVEEAQSEEDHIDKIHVEELHDVVIDSEEIGMEETHNEEICEKVQNKEVYVKQIHKDLPANKKLKPENPSSDSQSGSEHYTEDSDQGEPSTPPKKKPRLNLKRPLRSSYESRRMHSRAETPRRTTREKEWLSFQKEIERERIRIRKRELQHQGRWLDLFEQFLELGNRVVDVMDRRHF